MRATDNQNDWINITIKPTIEDSVNDINNILSPTSSNSKCLDLKYPKIETDIKTIKFNLFDKLSFIQLIEFIIKSKINSNLNNICNSKTIRNRGIIYSWLKNQLDLTIVENNEFLINNKKKLLNFKNKRQLIMFLNKYFKNYHHLNEKSTVSNSLINLNRIYSFSKFIILSIFLSILLILISIKIIFNTSIIESYLLKKSDNIEYFRLVKSVILHFLSNN